MKKGKRNRKRKLKNLLLSILAVLALLVIGFLILRLYIQKQQEADRQFLEEYNQRQELMENNGENTGELPVTEEVPTEPVTESHMAPLPTEPMAVGEQIFSPIFEAYADENTILVGDEEVLSLNALLVDLSNDRIVAKKGTDDIIYPASMTKILTILVAAEQIQNLDDTFTMTPEIIAYSLRNGCSAAGFVEEEVIPVKDLFYGTILPSGGEAAVALATYVSGSQEAFVELMNQKLEQLGLSDTAHFTNCVGLYDDNHYCTMLDMAMILKAAVENDFCREVLKEHVYYTEKTEQNPEGLILSNWFLRKIEDKDSGGLVTCAKTGYVAQSNCCAASYLVSNTGKPYICVTVDTYSEWRCIYDHVAMYKTYTE